MRGLLLCWFMLVSASVGWSQTKQPPVKILFVGNSLSYTNNIPALLAELYSMDGRKADVKCVCLPDYSLEDHWNDKNVLKDIKQSKYDIVIGQQGPSALPESQALLKTYAGKFAEVCASHQTQFALYMVWPAGARLFDLDNAILSYTAAAASTGALLCPAGLAWKHAWQADNGIPLYGPDNFHPSLTGSVLAAITIYGALTKKTDFEFIDYQKVSWRAGVPEAQFRIMKEASVKALYAK